MNEVRDERPQHFTQIDNSLWDTGLIVQMGATPYLIYSTLCWRANWQTRQCFPSLDTLTKDTGLSKHTVIDGLKKLEQLGVIRIERRMTPGEKSYTSTLYTIVGTAGVVQKLHQGSAKIALGVVQKMHQGSAENAPELDESNNTNSDETNLTTKTLAKGSRKRDTPSRNGHSPKEEGRTVPAWNAYAAAYLQRYKVPPTRNQSINGIFAKFVDHVPLEDAPAIADFYVWHNGQDYIRSNHHPRLLLRDCEGLRTQWLSGRRVTNRQAAEADRLQGQGDIWREVAQDLAAKEKTAHAG